MAGDRRTRIGWALERWSGLGAIAYVVLFIVGAILLFGGAPDGDAAPGKVIAWYSDSGHRDRIHIGWVLIGLGVLLLLWFVAGLREWVARVDGFLATAVAVGGTLYATLALLSVSLNDAVRTMSDDTYRHRVFPELVHAADDAGYVIHAAGGAGAAVMIAAASLAALRAGAVPSWAAWVGVALGVIGLFSILFFPQLAIAIWLLAAGALLLRGGGRGYGVQSAPR
jgi:hypothetical protein